MRSFIFIRSRQRTTSSETFFSAWKEEKEENITWIEKTVFRHSDFWPHGPSPLKLFSTLIHFTIKFPFLGYFFGV